LKETGKKVNNPSEASDSKKSKRQKSASRKRSRGGLEKEVGKKKSRPTIISPDEKEKVGTPRGGHRSTAKTPSENQN